MSEDKNLGNSELNAADELTNAPQEQQPVEYTDDNIRHLSDMEHVRTRPGMYIGRLGDGNLPEDGIYVLLKEVVDNSIDEFKMGAGARLEIDIEDNLRVSVRDYGRGIPQGKLVERCGCEGGQCPQFPLRSKVVPRRKGAPSEV